METAVSHPTSQLFSQLVEGNGRTSISTLYLPLTAPPTAWRTIQGYESMNMIRKGQIEGAKKGNIQAQNQFIAGLFGLAV